MNKHELNLSKVSFRSVGLEASFSTVWFLSRFSETDEDNPWTYSSTTVLYPDDEQLWISFCVLTSR